jgi:hypothetical protein
MPGIPLQEVPIVLFAALCGNLSTLRAQVVLSADGVKPACTQVRNALAASPETPDCSHPEFGPHITKAVDQELNKYVFVFNMHVTPDNDRRTNFDRQRLEIKTKAILARRTMSKGF